MMPKKSNFFDPRPVTIGLIVAALALPAIAGDGPPSPVQEVRILQSGLDVLGLYDGPIDGQLQPPTRAALERFAADTGFTGDLDQPTRALFDALATAIGPALIAGFGTDPTGSWDVDLSGLGDAEAREILDLHHWETLELCSSPLAIHFQGMAYAYWLYGAPTVIALRDGRLEPVLDPEYPDLAQPAFTFVNDDTMRRVVDGKLETWHRCD